MKDVKDVNEEVRKQRPNFLDMPGPITSKTLRAGLKRIDAESFEKAWHSFGLLVELLDFIWITIHDGAPDFEGNMPPMNPAYTDVDKFLSEAYPLIDGLYFDFWAAFVPVEEEVGRKRVKPRSRMRRH